MDTTTRFTTGQTRQHRWLALQYLGFRHAEEQWVSDPRLFSFRDQVKALVAAGYTKADAEYVLLHQLPRVA